MKKYFKDFVAEDDGIETIEFIGLVAVAAVLIGIIITIASKMKDAATSAETNMNAQLESLKDL